jgi:hypothetical protein
MRPLSGNPAATIAVKAAASAGAIYLSERLWKKNRAAAVIAMIAANGLTGYVVSHNLRTARARR